MNTFHIYPSDALAADAAEEVEKFSDHALIAIRGQMVEDGTEYVYTVSECPSVEVAGHGYMWTYVRVADWLREFRALRP